MPRAVGFHLCALHFHIENFAIPLDGQQYGRLRFRLNHGRRRGEVRGSIYRQRRSIDGHNPVALMQIRVARRAVINAQNGDAAFPVHGHEHANAIVFPTGLLEHGRHFIRGIIERIGIQRRKRAADGVFQQPIFFYLDIVPFLDDAQNLIELFILLR